MNQCAECGTLCRDLRTFVKDAQVAEGLVLQCLKAIIQRELGLYYRFLAEIEGNLNAFPDDYYHPKRLTLRGLLVKMQPAILKLRLLKSVARGCQGG